MTERTAGNGSVTNPATNIMALKEDVKSVAGHDRMGADGPKKEQPSKISKGLPVTNQMPCQKHPKLKLVVLPSTRQGSGARNRMPFR